MSPTVLAISKAIELITVATELSAAASRVSALIAKAQAAGRDITDEEWNSLLADRAMAQAMLMASIRKREVTEG